jgi:hypothetical protein
VSTFGINAPSELSPALSTYGNLGTPHSIASVVVLIEASGRPGESFGWTGETEMEAMGVEPASAGRAH